MLLLILFFCPFVLASRYDSVDCTVLLDDPVVNRATIKNVGAGIKNFRIEFKLLPGDLLMMDNYRLLHGRTTYDANEGNRFLQGCYIDYDSTEGRLKHLKRKFNY